MNGVEQQQLIGRHYSKRLQKWIDEYENPSGYPFSRIRLERILQFLKQKGITRKTILDVGCGVGIPGMEVAQPESDLYGFDLSAELVEWARNLAKKRNLSAEYVVGSATDGGSYPNRKFDVVLALGVFQHIENDLRVLQYMKRCLNLEGWMILSLRNPLFALVTFNRPSYELFMGLFKEFLGTEDGHILDDFLKSKFDLSLPPRRSGSPGDPGLDDVVYKHHNPLTVERLLARAGLRVAQMDFYRHHATPPLLEQRAPEQFKTRSLELDLQENDWRSWFLCSTYIVYCRHA
ncbi:class I SAM-dependent methyltransferase [Acidobacteria bacterium AH-259-A15]|nr:class I SAM-dependent methyltransferase [Acidobacteria bacterium AH-259-A15]